MMRKAAHQLTERLLVADRHRVFARDHSEGLLKYLQRLLVEFEHGLGVKCILAIRSQPGNQCLLLFYDSTRPAQDFRSPDKKITMDAVVMHIAVSAANLGPDLDSAIARSIRIPCKSWRLSPAGGVSAHFGYPHQIDPDLSGPQEKESHS
jgi:hypothetical protein